MISPFQPHPIPPGASLYYALLFAPAKHRLPISIINTFEREIVGIADKIQEPQVAKAKLSWWSQEIAHTYQDKPHHPLSQALVPLIKQYDLPQAWFQQIITVTQNTLDNPYFETIESVNLFCQHHAGKTLLWSNILKAPDEKTPEDFAILISTCIQFIQMIRYFGKDCANGKIYFPTHDLAHFNITENELYKRNCSPTQLHDFLVGQAQHAKEYYVKALQVLPKEMQLAQQPLIILAKLYLVLLSEIEKDKYAVFHHKYSLTPLRKFWVAWTTHLSEKRKAKRLLPTE